MTGSTKVVPGVGAAAAQDTKSTNLPRADARTDMQRARDELRQAANEARAEARREAQQSRESEEQQHFKAIFDGRARRARSGEMVVQTPRAPGEPTVGVSGGRDFENMGMPPEAVDISVAFFLMIAFVVVGWPISRAFARRMDRKSVAPTESRESSARLERIEQAVDSIAIEVERVSEGQRYTTRLMSEMRGLPAPNAADALAQAGLRGGMQAGSPGVQIPLGAVRP